MRDQTVSRRLKTDFLTSSSMVAQDRRYESRQPDGSKKWFRQRASAVAAGIF